MRDAIEQIPIKQLQSYNLGFGNATTRTSKQKQLALKYTHQLIDAEKGLIIAPDGSIYTPKNIKNKNNPPRYGGYGISFIDSRDIRCGYAKSIWTIKGQVPTRDAQLAELFGIAAALSHVHNNLTKYKNHIINNSVSIFCDCLNAVRYVNGIYKIPGKYASIVQAIHENIDALHDEGFVAQIAWIPGHTGHPLNDEADDLAKAAAQSWENPEADPPNYKLRPDTDLEVDAPVAFDSSSSLPSSRGALLRFRGLGR